MSNSTMELESLRADVLRLEAQVRDVHAYAQELFCERNALCARLDAALAALKTEDGEDDLLPAIERLWSRVVELRTERNRLQRACDEGLPREVILCPACGRRHLDGANGAEFATRPHHTHLCQHCGHVWDHGRWSFGAPDGLVSPPVPWFDAPTHKGLWWAHLAHADGRERMDVVQAAQDPCGDWHLRFLGEPTPLYLATLRGAWAKVRFTPALSPTALSPMTAPPTREEVKRHLQEHGGFWQVSRVLFNGEWCPMTLLMASVDDWLHACIFDRDFGAKWDDDPFRLMEGAEWTPLTREGRRLHRLAA